MTWYKKWFGDEYLDLYSYRDDDEARRHVLFVRDRFGTFEGELLDLACGSGRHLQELARQGYRVLGCDLSFTLLRKAISEHHASGLVIRADMRHLPFRDARFGGLANFFTSFGYFETDKDNEAAAREIARILRPRGRFLLDYLNVDRELKRLVQDETRDMEGRRVTIERWFDVSTKTFNKRISFDGKRYLERVRGYGLAELEALFEGVGVRTEQVFGDFDGSRFDEDSPRLILFGSRSA